MIVCELKNVYKCSQVRGWYISLGTAISATLRRSDRRSHVFAIELKFDMLQYFFQSHFRFENGLCRTISYGTYPEKCQDTLKYENSIIINSAKDKLLKICIKNKYDKCIYPYYDICN